MTFIWGPYNRDPTIWGTFLGSPIFGNSQLRKPAVAPRKAGSTRGGVRHVAGSRVFHSVVWNSVGSYSMHYFMVS